MNVEQDWSSNSFFLLFNKFEECIHHKDGDVSFRLNYSEAKNLHYLLSKQIEEYNQLENSYINYMYNLPNTGEQSDGNTF